MTRTVIKFVLLVLTAMPLSMLSAQTTSNSNSTVVKKGAKYDTIIRKHVDKPVLKAKPVQKPVIQEVVLPVPEFVNQPSYYDKVANKLINLESTTAQLVTKKKTLGLKGAKQFFSMDGMSSKVRFITKDSMAFFIKTSGDVIDLTSYIKLYKFIPEDQKREVVKNMDLKEFSVFAFGIDWKNSN